MHATADILPAQQDSEGRDSSFGSAFLPAGVDMNRAASTMIRHALTPEIIMAKQDPRSPSRSLTKAKEQVAMSREIAEMCFYTTKRYDKKLKRDVYIPGPSIRLAEILAAAWGNLSIGVKSIDEKQEYVEVVAFCKDLETNTTYEQPVRRNIITNKGERYSADMVTTTINAATSFSMRNAILRHLRVYAEVVLKIATEVATGGQKALPQRRQEVVKRIKDRWGIEDVQIATAVGARDVEDLDMEQVSALIAICTEISDGDLDLNEVFPPLDARALLAKKEQPQEAAPEEPQKRSMLDRPAPAAQPPKQEPKPEPEPATSNGEPEGVDDSEFDEEAVDDAGIAGAIVPGDVFRRKDGSNAPHEHYRVDEKDVERKGVVGCLCWFSDDGGATWNGPAKNAQRTFIPYERLEGEFDIEQPSDDLPTGETEEPGSDETQEEHPAPEPVTDADSEGSAESDAALDVFRLNDVEIRFEVAEEEDEKNALLYGPMGTASAGRLNRGISPPNAKWLDGIREKSSCSILHEAATLMVRAGLSTEAIKNGRTEFMKQHGVKKWTDLDSQARLKFREIGEAYLAARQEALGEKGD